MVVQNEDGALSVKTMRGSSHHIVRSTGAFKSDFTRRWVKKFPTGRSTSVDRPAWLAT